MSMRGLLATRVERRLFGTVFTIMALGLALVPLVFGLLLGVALAAPTTPSGSAQFASAAAPTLNPAPAPAASVSQTHVDEIVHEIQSLQTLSKVQIAVIGVAALALAGLLLLLLIRYARIADKMKFGFGLLEFEVNDAVRDATKRAEDAEEDVRASSRAVNTIYAMVHTLQVVGASNEPAAFTQFLKHCAEEAAAHVDTKKSGTVRASVWLATNDDIGIVAGYRVTSHTMKNFKLSQARPGFAWEVFKSAKWSIKNTKDDEEAVAKDPDSRYEVAWILGVPIWADESKKEPVGVLCVSHDREEPLTKTDATICSFYADLASTAIRLAQLRQVALS